MRFRPNPRFVQQLRREPEMLEELHSQAKDVRKVAAALAPEKTTYYVKHLEVAKDAVGWRVESTDPFGHLVEWGSSPHQIEVTVDGKKKKKMVGGNPAYAPLRKAVRVVRLRFVPEPKKTS